MESGYKSYRRFLEGDDEGIVEMMRDYRDGLILYINCIVHNIRVAKELCEETFVRIYVKKPRYSAKYSFKAWLYAIGRNVTRNYLKKHKRDEQHIAADESIEDIEDRNDIEREHIKNEDRIQLHRAMMKLKTEYRQILTLVYFEGMSNAESARIMHKTKRQTECLLYNAKKALRNELERSGFEYGGL